MFKKLYRWVSKSIVNKFTILLLLGITIPVLAVSIITYRVTSAITYENSFSSIQKNLRSLASGVDSVRFKIISMSDAFYFNKISTVTGKPYAEYSPIERYMDKDYMEREVILPISLSLNYLNHMFLFKDTGNVYTNYNFASGTISYSEMKETFEKKYLSLVDEKSYTAYWLSTEKKVFDRNMITFARAIKDKFGQNIGILLWFVDNNILTDLFVNMDYDMDDEVMLVDSSGVVISCMSSDKIGRSMKELIGIDSFSDSSYMLAEIDGVRKMISMVKSNDSQWYLVNIIPVEMLFNKMEVIRKSILLSVFLAVVATVVIGKLILNRTTRSLEILQKKAIEVSEGNLDLTIDLKGSDEVAQLGSCLDEMLARIRRLIDDVVKEQKMNARLEIKVHQSQLNPHFLFNTLNNIKWIALSKGNSQIADMVSELGNILEGAMRNRSGMIKVRNEFELLKSYMAIQKFRYKDKFEVHLAMDEKAGDLYIPVLTLQPLVENAVFHGIGRKEFINIDVSCDYYEDYLEIKVTDDGCGISGEVLEGIFDKNDGDDYHIGLNNIKRRIQLRFGTPYDLKIISERGQGTQIIIILPVVKEFE